MLTLMTQKGLPVRQAGLAPILIVVLIIVALGGYLIYANYSNNQTTITPSSTPSAINPTPISSAASPVPNGSGKSANWKTYTNRMFGYSLKYPQNWLLNEDYADQNGGYFTHIQSQEYKLNKSDVQLYEIYIHHRNSSLEAMFGKERAKSYRQGILNNYQVFRSISYPQYWSDDVFFQIKDNQFIEINFSPYNIDTPYPNQDNVHRIFDQILSTFKFTN